MLKNLHSSGILSISFIAISLYQICYQTSITNWPPLGNILTHSLLFYISIHSFFISSQAVCCNIQIYPCPLSPCIPIPMVLAPPWRVEKVLRYIRYSLIDLRQTFHMCTKRILISYQYVYHIFLFFHHVLVFHMGESFCISHTKLAIRPHRPSLESIFKKLVFYILIFVQENK